MSSLSGSVSFQPHEREQLDELLALLRKARRKGENTELAELLAPVGPPLRRPFLLELIRADLKLRYRYNCPLLLEDYLRQLPELGPAEGLPPELIYQEYHVRHLYGDAPALASYQERFPSQFAQLQRLAQEEPSNSLASSLLPPPPDPPPPPPALQKVGGAYTVRQRLGSGQNGEVFRALAPGGVEVALKRIYRPLLDQASQREQQALELIKSLRHPFLLQTQAYWTEEDRLYIVMELADNSLHDHFEECRNQGLPGIPRDELLAYFVEAAEALDFLHSQQVIHRDIKPANLLCLKGHAKVADFGLARLFEGNEDAATFCGTPLYMAPEIWQNQISAHADQYSLAATFIEMCAGHRAFPGGNLAAICQQHTESPPNLEGFSAAEQQVLRKALSKSPQQRYPTCRAFVEALRQACAPPAPPAARSLLPQVLASVVGTLAVALVLWLFFLHPGAPPPPPHWLPEGYEPAEPGDSAALPKRLLYTGLKGVAAVEFLLIDRTNRDDPPPFYIMRDKVTNEQFRAALAQQAMQVRLARWGALCPKAIQDKGRPPGWENLPPQDARRPVIYVTALEALCFAELLDGKLPSCRQWDKAGGRFDGQEGPFQRGWKGPPIRKAPTPVGQDKEDESIFGCRGMAANGREITADLQNNTGLVLAQVVQQKLEDSVVLRGGSFDDGEPFRWGEVPDALPYGKPRRDVGFRVVLERPTGP